MLACRRVAISFNATSRTRRWIFDTPEYYDRIFGELGRGEVLEWYNIDWQDVEPVLESFFRQLKPRRILDLGCGTSRLPAQLCSRQFARLIVGCDVSSKAVAQQKALTTQRSPGSRLIFHTGDASRLPYRDKCFDIILEKGLFDALGSTRPSQSHLHLPSFVKVSVRCATVQWFHGNGNALEVVLGSQLSLWEQRGAAQVPPMLVEAWRVLAPGGALISLSQPGQAEMKASTRLICNRLQCLSSRWGHCLHSASAALASSSQKKAEPLEVHDFQRKLAAAHKEADDRCDALQKGLVNKLHLTQRAMEKASSSLLLTTPMSSLDCLSAEIFPD
eukprot:symbB.v1.2.010268.t4/scaffold619.1/size180033/4